MADTFAAFLTSIRDFKTLCCDCFFAVFTVVVVVGIVVVVVLVLVVIVVVRLLLPLLLPLSSFVAGDVVFAVLVVVVLLKAVAKPKGPQKTIVLSGKSTKLVNDGSCWLMRIDGK